VQHGWAVEGDVVHFHKAAAVDANAEQHLRLINHALLYAKELERIV
jgi:hypothetical protein